MSIESVRATFGLENSRDVLHKLEWEIRGLKEIDDTLIDDLKFAAFNACVTGWAIRDWICKDATPDQREAICTDLRLPIDTWHRGESTPAWVAGRPWLEVCKEICNASKHGGVTYHPNEAIDAHASAAGGAKFGEIFEVGSDRTMADAPIAPIADENIDGYSEKEISLAIEKLGTTRWTLKAVYGDERIPIVDILDRVLDFWTGLVYRYGIAE